jgi:hypothetical protein
LEQNWPKELSSLGELVCNIRANLERKNGREESSSTVKQGNWNFRLFSQQQQIIKVRLHQSLELKTRFKVASRNSEEPPSHASKPTGNSYFIFRHQKTPFLAEPIICKIYQFEEAL